jgi:site-specific DNA-methyltransferase (adenine-specific)
MNDKVVLGDCLAVMKDLPDDCVDAIVCDPPAGIAFMGKEWDTDKGGRHQWVAWMESVAVECLRVLKPGGYALVWALPRTSHWTGWAWENAGWEPRDKLVHLFGCLSEDTEILINGRWEPYQKAVVGSLALCYDVEHDTFAQHEIQETYLYPYEDTAFRIQSDRTDQIVSRGHRCLVERGGKFSFASAETLMGEENVPILENLQGLLTALCLSDEDASSPQQDVPWVQPQANVVGEEGEVPYTTGSVSEMQQGIPPQEPLIYGQGEVLLQYLQSAIPDVGSSGSGKNDRDSQAWACRVDGRESEVRQQEDDRPTQSSLEGRGNVLPETWELQRGEVHSLSNRVPSNGSEGWLRDGTSDHSGDDNRSLPTSSGDSSSRGSRSNEQRTDEPGVVQVKSGPQTVRASRFTTSDLAGITPFHLTGKVWCVKTPTGAFVARRNGKVFITGNSGFPKSLDVSKAIDKAAGAEREVTGKRTDGRYAYAFDGNAARPTGGRIGTEDANRIGGFVAEKGQITAPATDAAKQWEGWGTALKPAGEDWWVFRKPLIGTVAANVLQHGTGGINIDACRIGTTKRVPGGLSRTAGTSLSGSADGTLRKETGEESGHNPNVGRWPANVVLSHFPECQQVGERRIVTGGSGVAPVVHDSAGYRGESLGTDSRMDGDVRHTFKNPDGTETVPAWECSTDCAVRLLDEQSGTLTSGVPGKRQKSHETNAMAGMLGMLDRKETGYADTGGASRFFYCAKASRSERTHGGTVENKHPTVKAISLMRYLVRLVTPPGGSVLDPFCGSGSTLVAAELEGFDYLGIEQDPESHKTTCKRLANAEMLRKKTNPKTTQVAEEEG